MSRIETTMELVRFDAPWSRGLLVSTVLVSGFIVATTLLVAFLLRGRPMTAALVCTATAAPLVVAWALAPRGFLVNHGQLVVERPLSPVRIARDEIKEARCLDASEVQRLGIPGALRTLGTSGLFGHYGRFRSGGLGNFRMYATRSDGLVLIDTTQGPIVLTPDDPDRLCASLRPARP
jgi:hypothetical protein